jgi:hypothetical protein
MTKYFTPYRLATYLLVIFFAGHTFGGMLGQRSLGAASDAVFDAMKAVHFDFNGADCTWYGFWFGFGLMASIFLLFSAVISWQLDRVPKVSWPLVSTIAWALFATHVGVAVLSWAYFFTGPGIFSTLAAGLMAVGALRQGTRATA